MPRDNDKNNDSPRGRRDGPSGDKGRSGKPRGPEKKFAKRGFAGKSDGDKRPYTPPPDGEKRPYAGKSDGAKSMKEGAVMPRFSQQTLVRERIQQKWTPVLRENAPRMVSARIVAMTAHPHQLDRPFIDTRSETIHAPRQR